MRKLRTLFQRQLLRDDFAKSSFEIYFEYLTKTIFSKTCAEKNVIELQIE